MKIKSFTKKAICVALLAGASVGANAASPVYPLGGATVGLPLSFNSGLVAPGPFGDVFTFDLPANGGSGYSVITFDIPRIPDADPNPFLFNTKLASLSLVSNADGSLYNTDDTVIKTVVIADPNQTDKHLNLSWGTLAAGHYYLYVSGITNGTLGGLYNGAITVSAPPVPEPESYAMFLAGLGLMGVIVRRRMRSQS